MPRKIVVGTEGGEFPVLVEALADDEAQLQELVKTNPDLIPVEEFGMTGPLLVVGRETTVPSGAIDLVALSGGGEVLIVEFKTGPQNADFRHTIAQLLDYGAHLWELSLHDFENQVAIRFFTSPSAG
jgi:RecB family endonuclease NucS